ncbi:MAG: TIGR03960 family B12-binding radical SAM protein [Candidatus Edwardsbacteria bacterium]
MKSASLEKILPLVSKPGRYLGNELNAIHKDYHKVKVKVALVYPDLYELGMSGLGLKILYHLLNQFDDVVVERAYAPGIDLEALLRRENLCLFSQETHHPLSEFDLIGITLQTELTYTNVLNILDLSRIPLYSEERTEENPLVLGGGPAAFNPEPLSRFFDAFVIGEGEEIIIEIVDWVKKWKFGEIKRHQCLTELSKLKGVYVPLLNQKRVLRCFVPALASDDCYLKPLVPYLEITHDRLTIEIMRGCPKGCRFCQAGVVYRPLRVRSVREIVELVREGISQTGWEEVSLLSLSTSNYPLIIELIKKLNQTLAEKKVALSVPSLRFDNFTIEFAKSLKIVKKTGLTFAPEAGTQRLRDVINKGLTEDSLLEAVRIAKGLGWHLVKLYFMIGLPTETEEDLVGIVSLVEKLSRIDVGLKVNITPFIPKPHTPFQWERQQNVSELKEKQKFLKDQLRYKRNVQVKWRNPELSVIEGIFARGDKELGRVLEKAWALGCKFDEWSEHFKFDLWMQAFQKCGINPDDYLTARDTEKSLPWDYIDTGVTKDFLRLERVKAFSCEVTPDCQEKGCYQCGLKCEGQKPKTEGQKPKAEIVTIYGRGRKKIAVAKPTVNTRFRLRFSKGEEVRFTSHLDLMRAFSRAVRRANLPIAYSEGFSPHPKIAFGPPLPLGMTSDVEYLDLQLQSPFSDDLISALNRVLPCGLRILEAKPLFGKETSLDEFLDLAEYEFLVPENLHQKIKDGLNKFSTEKEIFIQRIGKEQIKTMNIKPYILKLALKDSNLGEMCLVMGQRGGTKPHEVFARFFLLEDTEIASLRVKRTGLYHRQGEIFFPPM